MNIKQFLIILMALLAVLISRQASAVSCGDLITSNIMMTADLHCTTGYFAVEIGANNVTFDLNGHTLSGTTDLVGVRVSGLDNVSIIGNGGVIKGFWAGVNSSRSDFLHVNGTTFYELGTGIIISSGNDAVIKNNDFIRIDAQGVYIYNSVAGNQANRNKVNNNEFYQSAIGIELCGDDSNRNTIKNNLIWQSNYYGIRLSRSDRNSIINNRIIDTNETAIRLNDSSKNRIKGNSLREGQFGLEILADAGSGCLGTGPTVSKRNVFNGNHTFEFQTGVVIGIGTTATSQVFNNDLRYNKLYDNQLGIFFNDDAHNNDATSNAYTGTTTPLLDSGVSNSY